MGRSCLSDRMMNKDVLMFCTEALRVTVAETMKGNRKCPLSRTEDLPVRYYQQQNATRRERKTRRSQLEHKQDQLARRLRAQIVPLQPEPPILSAPVLSGELWLRTSALTCHQEWNNPYKTQRCSGSSKFIWSRQTTELESASQRWRHEEQPESHWSSSTVRAHQRKFNWTSAATCSL